MLYDTHAHLDMRQFDEDRKEVIESAKENNIGIITVGTDIESSNKAIEIAEKYDLYCAVGIHPHDAKKYPDLEKTNHRLEELALSSEKVVAIGEVGLDFYKNYSPKKDQIGILETQLLTCRNLNLPAIIHNRESDTDLLNILKEFEPSGVIHSFFGDYQLASKFLDLGLYLGISGPITFPNANHKKSVGKVPVDRLLVETDCPFLTPKPYRGKRNEPSYVRYIAQEIADLKDMAISDIADATSKNVANLFDISIE